MALYCSLGGIEGLAAHILSRLHAGRLECGQEPWCGCLNSVAIASCGSRLYRLDA